MQRRSRRTFLASLAAATCAAQTTGKGRVFPSVAVRYSDPATEFRVVRLTDPQFTSSLAAAGNRGVTARQLLYASDMGGSWQAFHMDLKSKESRQVTDAAALDPASIGLVVNDRSFRHFDGPKLVETAFYGLKSRELCRVPEGFEKLPGASYSADGQYAVWVEKNATHYRLQLMRVQTGLAATLLESPEELRDPLFRPHSTSLVYRRSGDFWTVGFDAKQNRKLPLAEGETFAAQWTGDGHALEYLNRPPDPKQLTSLREWTPENGAQAGRDARVAETSQFVQFQANANASVYVGASGSKASPYLLLLIRAARRELTLAEHRSSDPSLVAPAFAPNSQFVIFVSDRHGKPAIYWIAVDKLVSETDGS
jgi:oligogalacturonide lyase